MVLTEKIPLFKVFMSPRAKHKVATVLDSGFIGQGPKVEEFEAKLREYFRIKNLVTVNSGTSGLHLALHLLKDPFTYREDIHGVAYVETEWYGLDPTDFVLTTALTCTATNFPILANDLNIQWVDVDPTTLNMDLDDLERKITPRTRVIIAMHWGGYPLDMDRLEQIQDNCYTKFGFKPIIIEDCAHAFGSLYKGRKLGTLGNISMFSFQAIKHVTSVDGGLLTFPDNMSELADRAKLLRWYGIDRDESKRTDFRCEADIAEWGFKFHMNDINATIGMENLSYADVLITSHRENAEYYDKELANVPGVTLLTRHPDRKSSFWIYSILVENRAGFYEHMKQCNIMVSQVHERNDKHTALASYKSSLPVLDSTIGSVVSIPVGWWVTKTQREYIVNCIKQGW